MLSSRGLLLGTMAPAFLTSTLEALAGFQVFFFFLLHVIFSSLSKDINKML